MLCYAFAAILLSFFALLFCFCSSVLLRLQRKTTKLRGGYRELLRFDLLLNCLPFRVRISWRNNQNSKRETSRTANAKQAKLKRKQMQNAIMQNKAALLCRVLLATLLLLLLLLVAANSRFRALCNLPEEEQKQRQATKLKHLQPNNASLHASQL